MTYRIYGYDDCKWCAKAKALLEEMAVPFEYHDLGPLLSNRSLFLDSRGFTGQSRTFPRVYRLENGIERLVGGYVDLESDVMLSLSSA